MQITPDEVRYVAALARLDLPPAEVEAMSGQLGRILGYVAKLNELDTTGVAATTHALNIHNAFREDAVGESLPQAVALANGPRHNETAFVVPKVI
jgi:aspartyl-tRNA(Asn)/glutamyl-tRNA(Gln) amidotransferase subunit C